jgi:CheY-like chemotaxis protein
MNTLDARQALASLERMGGSRLVRDVIAVFERQAPAYARAAREAWKRGEAAALGRAAHALKGSSAQLGASRLAELCGAAEALAEGGALAEAEALLADIDAELDEFLRHLPRIELDAGRGLKRRLVGVVEDNEDTRLIVRKILEPVYDVEESASGDDALERFVRRVPDAILLDISLPGIDGLEVLARLRASPVLGRVPVIALTAHAMVGDREGFLARGFDGYASKPIMDERELLDAVRGALEARG